MAYQNNRQHNDIHYNNNNAHTLWIKLLYNYTANVPGTNATKENGYIILLYVIMQNKNDYTLPFCNHSRHTVSSFTILI